MLEIHWLHFNPNKVRCITWCFPLKALPVWLGHNRQRLPCWWCRWWSKWRAPWHPMNKPTKWARPERHPAQRAVPDRPREPWRSGTQLCGTAVPSSVWQEEDMMGHLTHVYSFWNMWTDLLHRWELLFEVIQFLQKLSLLQQVVFRLVDGRVQQMHHVFHVLQTCRMFAGNTHCDEGDNWMTDGRSVTTGHTKGQLSFYPFLEIWHHRLHHWWWAESLCPAMCQSVWCWQHAVHLSGGGRWW